MCMVFALVSIFILYFMSHEGEMVSFLLIILPPLLIRLPSSE